MILKDSRGVAAILVAVLITAIVGFAGFATDVGYYYYTKFKLQNTADATALAVIKDPDNRVERGHDMITRNGLNPAELERKDIELGDWDAVNEAFTPTETPAQDQQAVRVTLQRQIPAFFSRIFGVDYYHPFGRATAALVPQGAVVSARSTALTLQTDLSLLDPLIGGLLGTTINLGVLGWQGIATAQIDLVKFLNLAQADLHVGTVDEVLKTNVNLLKIIDLAIEALETEVKTADIEAAIAQLRILKLQVPALDVGLQLGDLLELDLNKFGSLAKADVDLLSLVMLAAEAFNHKAAVQAGVDVGLPGLVDLTLRLKVIEPPVIKIMEPDNGNNSEVSTIHTGQVRLFVNATVGGLLGGLLRVPLYLEVGAGDGTLDAINPNGDVEMTGRTSLAKLFLGSVTEEKFFGTADQPADDTLTEDDISYVRILNVLGLITADAKVYTNAEGREEGEMIFTPPFPETQTVRGALGTTLAQLLNSLVTTLQNDPNSLRVSLLGLGLNLGQVVGQIVGLLTPVVNPLLEGLLNPVTRLLGLFPGRTDLTVHDYAYRAALVQ